MGEQEQALTRNGCDDSSKSGGEKKVHQEENEEGDDNSLDIDNKINENARHIEDVEDDIDNDGGNEDSKNGEDMDSNGIDDEMEKKKNSGVFKHDLLVDEEVNSKSRGNFSLIT